ncbi:MAG TPA: hypothetical protein VMK05_08305 [Burkholderiales bacterium]|nr:hypothetical protein [Burkholderiales bacterium]
MIFLGFDARASVKSSPRATRYRQRHGNPGLRWRPAPARDGIMPPFLEQTIIPSTNRIDTFRIDTFAGARPAARG